MTGKAKTVTKLFALQEALRRSELTKSDVLVLAVLLEYTSGIYGYAWPSVESVHEVTGLDGRTVQRSIRRLEETGLVRTFSGGGRFISNRYLVALDQFTESPFSEPIKRAAAKRAAKRNRGVAATLCDEKGRQASPKGRQPGPETAAWLPPEPTDEPTDRNPSPYGAPPNGGALSPRNDDQLLAIKLRTVETAFKSGDYNQEQLRNWHPELEDLSAEHGGHKGDALGGWAGRLASECFCRMDDSDVPFPSGWGAAACSGEGE